MKNNNSLSSVLLHRLVVLSTKNTKKKYSAKNYFYCFKGKAKRLWVYKIVSATTVQNDHHLQISWLSMTFL